MDERAMRRLARVATVDDLRAMAQRRLPRPLFDFIDGAAFRERTLADNLRDLAALRFRQRVLTGVGPRDLGTTLLGQPATMPVAIAPTGMSGAMSGDGRGEIHAARAAHAAGVPFTLGMLSLTKLEELAEAVAPPWFQICPLNDHDLVRGLVHRARDVGCPVLIVTVTWPLPSRMNRMVRNPHARIPVRPTPGALLQYGARPLWSLGALLGRSVRMRNIEHHRPFGPGGIADLLDSGTSWPDIARIRDLWPGRLVLKGITNADEVAAAIDIGVDGVVVSNHGGNLLDECASTISMLPEVVEAAAGRIEVLHDGGIRSGQDVAKALALGARGCLLGRAHLYGLAAARKAGVAKMLEILRIELDTTCGFTGMSRVAQISPAILRASRVVDAA